MAFQFVVETGVGDPDANSYCSVEFADDYLITNIYAWTDWSLLDPLEKEYLLVRASRFVDQKVAWKGRKVEQDSGLRWPRACIYDQDGYLLPDDEIPVLIQQAVAEFASYLMNDDWTAPSGTRGVREIQVDVIDIKYDATVFRGDFPDMVSDMLSPFGSVTGGRFPAFKPIVRA